MSTINIPFSIFYLHDDFFGPISYRSCHTLKDPFNQLLTDGIGLLAAIVDKVFEKGRDGIRVAMLLDLTRLGEVHKVGTGTAEPVTAGTERGKVPHGGDIADHLVK